jgi:xanthine dehydrogenase YagS FAD-binding subunit
MITFARSVEEAVAGLPGEPRAGGTDLQERRRRGIARGPIVDLSRVPGLARIAPRAGGGVAIGALTRLSAVAADPALARDYPGVSRAARALATPQIRAVATVGGCLLQRTQCPYFRHPAFTCFKKGGATCPARAGHHEYGVCFDLGPCVHPHPSTLGLALLAYDAQVEIHDERALSMADLYGDGSDPTRDHLLGEGRLLTHVVLPPPDFGLDLAADPTSQIENPQSAAAYVRAAARAAAEWPLVEVVARLHWDERGLIRLARVAAGGVANIPLRLPHVEAALLGQPATPDVLARAAAGAGAGATPLPQTGYKVALLARTVLEALEQAARRA